MYLVVNFIILTFFVLSQREVSEHRSSWNRALVLVFTTRMFTNAIFQCKRYKIRVWVQHCVCINSNSLELRRSGRIAMVGALLEGAPTKWMCKNNVFESIHENLKSNFNVVLRLYDTAESGFGFGYFSWFMPNWVLFQFTTNLFTIFWNLCLNLRELVAVTETI